MRGNLTNILNCYFSKYVYPLADQTEYLRMENKIFSQKQNLFEIFSLKMQIRLTLTKVCYCLKRNTSYILKCSSCKKTFSLVCMLLVQLASMNDFSFL